MISGVKRTTIIALLQPLFRAGLLARFPLTYGIMRTENAPNQRLERTLFAVMEI
jgi:hypothetical protein